MVAGQPLTNDILKCQLKPLNPADYAVALSASQVERLKKMFPTGVCDYRKPGVAQQQPNGTWHDFTAGPGGKPTRSLIARSTR